VGTGIGSQPGDGEPVALVDAPADAPDTSPSVPGPRAAFPPPTATPRDRRRLLTGPITQTAVAGLLLAVMVHLRYGYQAGGGDHLRFSPEGLRWAHPDWFAGDWALANAPHPYLLFDVVTWVGAGTGLLSAAYLLFWLAAMMIVGAATTLLAHAWAPRHTWSAVLLVTVVLGVLPPALLGVATPLQAAALPSVLGGALVYLGAAALLTGRDRLVVAAVITAVFVDISAGLVLALLLGAVAVVAYVRTRQVPWLATGGAAAGLVLSATVLAVRPAVGGLDDLATACRTFTPQHCDPSSWVRSDLRSGAAAATLALLVVLFAGAGRFARREARVRFAAVIVAPWVLLLGAVGVEYLGLPGLAPLAQAVDLTQVGVVLFPFLAWGVVAPVFAEVAPRWRWLSLVAMMALVLAATEHGHWALDENADLLRPSWTAIVAFLFGVVVVARTAPEVVPRAATVIRAALGGAVVVVLLAGAFGPLTPRPFTPAFATGDPDLTAWGEAVQRAVPTGSVLMVPPPDVELRLVTKRAVVVDCLVRPTGGAARAEFEARLTALGGVDQCSAVNPRVVGYGDADLVAAAKRYGVRFIVLNRSQQWRAQDLVSAGWTRAVSAQGTVMYELFMAP
jgi:hypothetical protein